MEVGKESRSPGPGSKGVQDTSGKAAEADSRPPGEGSQNRGVWTNERGETCYGNDCVLLAIDPARREIRVNIKRSSACDVDSLVEALRQTLGEGARTVYEVESEYKEKPKK